MLNCIIVDDQAQSVQTLKNYIQEDTIPGTHRCFFRSADGVAFIKKKSRRPCNRGYPKTNS